MKRRLDRATAVLVGGLFVALVVVATLVGSGRAPRAGSVEDDGEDGRLALLMLVERLGFEPEIWKDPPGLLPSGDHVLWCARVPRSLQEHFAGSWAPDELEDEESEGEPEDEGAEPGEPEDEPGADDEPRRVPFVLHDLARYADFVREGGTLVLPAGTETDAFLTGTLGLEELAGVGELAPGSTLVEKLRDVGGETLRFDGNVRLFEAPDPEAYAEELLVAADDGRPFALAVPVGAGRVVLLADDAFVSNPRKAGWSTPSPRGIAASERALVVVRLLEELDRGGRLLFDEYALGRWVPDTAVGLAVSGVRGVLTLQLVLFLLVLAWRSSWVREFPRDPEALTRLSPLSRARGHAGLLERARRYDLLAGMLRRGSLRRMCALARIRLRGGEPHVGPDARRDALAEWRRWAEDRLDRALAAAGEERARARYREALFGRAPGTARELEELAGKLDGLERELARGLGREDR